MPKSDWIHTMYAKRPASDKRNFVQYQKDMETFFRMLGNAQSYGSADTRARRTEQFLADVRALGNK